MARGVDADTVEEYLERIGEPFGTALRTVRDRIVAIIPDVEQIISYRVPIFRLDGASVVGLSATAKECSLLLMSPPAAAELAGTMQEGTISGATIHFAPDRPLGEDTLRAVLDVRLRELGHPSPGTPSATDATDATSATDATDAVRAADLTDPTDATAATRAADPTDARSAAGPTDATDAARAADPTDRGEPL